MTFTVHVEYDDGSNATNSKVYLDIKGIGDTWTEGYTDRNGDADFEIDSDSADITFYVDGTKYQTETVDDGDCIYITI